MNYRILILLTVLFFILISIEKTDNGKTKTFSIRDSLNLKGIFCILIILGHLAAWTAPEKIFSNSIYFGYYSVGIFLFISGYGLSQKDLSFKGLLNKLVHLIIPFVLVNFVYYILFAFIGKPVSINEVLMSLINFHPLAYFSWYVVEIVIFYILYYLTVKIFKKQKTALIMLAAIFFYNLITYKLGLANSWWLSNYCFVLGIFMSKENNFISGNFLRKYKLSNAGGIILLLLSLDYVFVMQRSMETYSSIIIVQLSITLFALLIYFFLRKNELKSKVFEFIGDNSYEIYLFQGIPLLLLRSKIIYIQGNFKYTTLCIILSIILGFIFSKIDGFIYKKIKFKNIDRKL